MSSVALGVSIVITREGDPEIESLEKNRWVVTQKITIKEHNLRKDGEEKEFFLRMEVTKGRTALLGIPFLRFGKVEYPITVLNMKELDTLREEMGWIGIDSNWTFSIMIPQVGNAAVGEVLRNIGEL